MAFKLENHHILLGIAGIIAGGAVSYLVWKIEKREEASNASDAAAQAQAASDAQAQQQQELAELPQISFGGGGSYSVGDTGSTDTTSAGDGDGQTGSAEDSLLSQILAGWNASLTPTSTAPDNLIPSIQSDTTSEPTPVTPIIPTVTPLSVTTNSDGTITVNGSNYGVGGQGPSQPTVKDNHITSQGAS